MPSTTPVPDGQLLFLRPTSTSIVGSNGERPTKVIDASLLFDKLYLPANDLSTGVKRFRKFAVGTIDGDISEESYIVANMVIGSLDYDLPNYNVFYLTQGATLEQQFDSKQSDIPVTTAGVPTARLYGPGYLTQSAALGSTSITVDTRRGEYRPIQTGDSILLSQSYWLSSSNTARLEIHRGATGQEYFEIVSATAVSYLGDIATVSLAEPLNYELRKQSFVSSCLRFDGDITNHAGAITITRAGSSTGTFDDTTYPIAVHPAGGVAQRWTLSFVSNSAFNIVGDTLGTVGGGNIYGNAAPINPKNNKPYFTISSSGWTGTFSAGDTVSFYTFTQCVNVWQYIEVPPNTPPATNTFFNRFVICG